MIEVGEARREEFDWIEKRTGCVLTRNATALAAWKDGVVIGMLAFDEFTPASARMHMAVDEPVAWRRLRPAMVDYVFRYADKMVLLGVIPSHNTHSMRVAKKLGGQEMYRVKDGWSIGDDLVVFEMRLRRQHG